MRKMAMVFPGQGSQYVGMGKELCLKYPTAQQTFETASEVLGFDLQKLCFAGDLSELTKTENAQPALLTASVAAFRVFMEELRVIPKFLAGHSLGEISALTCSGAIQFTDAVKLVHKRGMFMQEAVPLGLGAMAAISEINREVIEAQCREASSQDKIVVVSNYNSPAQIVISGHLDAVNRASEKLKKMGARVIPLKVSAPFHSPLMAPAANRFQAELVNHSFQDLKCPVISNVTGLPYVGKESMVTNLTDQITQPVQWQAGVEYIQSQGVDLVIEMGPQTVLKKLVAKITDKIQAFSFDKAEDVKSLEKILESQVHFAKNMGGNKPTVISRCLAIAVSARNRNWNNDEYQTGAVEPYQKIQQLQEELEKEKAKPTLEQMVQALDMLQSVFTTKKVPLSEQISRFNQIFEETGTRELLPNFKLPSENLMAPVRES